MLTSAIARPGTARYLAWAARHLAAAARHMAGAVDAVGNLCFTGGTEPSGKLGL